MLPYNPIAILRQTHPEMETFHKTAGPEVAEAARRLAGLEIKGKDTSYARTALYEANWWIGCTANVKKADAALKRLRAALECKDPPDALTQDADGSFAPGTEVWYIKLQRSTDQLLAREWPWRRPPAFLEQINEPARMVTYLLDHSWSDVVRCGQDNRRQLNEAISVIARLVVKGGQAGYLSGPNFYPVLAQFIRDWQDPETGFFGMTYILEDGRRLRTTELSMTFHMAHYVPHLVRWWPRLIDTLFKMRENDGWPEGMNKLTTNHNNYDVVELFYRAWPFMEPVQRCLASEAIAHMLDWCLEESIDSEGEVTNPDNGDPLADSYYFAAAFLNTVGFFDASKRFWARGSRDDALFKGSESIRTAMIAQVGNFDPNYTGVDDTLEQLGAKTRPWSNAIL